MTEDGRKWLVLERDLELHSVDGYDRSQWNDAFVVVPATRMDTAVIRAEATEAERDRLADRVAELEGVLTSPPQHWADQLALHFNVSLSEICAELLRLAALAGEDEKPPEPQREGDYL